MSQTVSGFESELDRLKELVLSMDSCNAVQLREKYVEARRLIDELCVRPDCPPWPTDGTFVIFPIEKKCRMVLNFAGDDCGLTFKKSTSLFNHVRFHHLRHNLHERRRHLTTLTLAPSIGKRTLHRSDFREAVRSLKERLVLQELTARDQELEKSRYDENDDKSDFGLEELYTDGDIEVTSEGGDAAHPGDGDTVHPQDDFDVHPGDGDPIHPEGGVTVRPQRGFAVHPQGDVSVHPQRGFAVRPQGDFTVHPQGDVSVHPQAGFVIRPQADFAVHPQGGFAVHPGAGSAIHSQGGLAVHPRASFALRPQGDVAAHSQGDVAVHRYTGFAARPQAGFAVHPVAGFALSPQGDVAAHPQGGFAVHTQANFAVHPQAVDTVETGGDEKAHDEVLDWLAQVTDEEALEAYDMFWWEYM
ncbi:hypothetical protein DFP73DRAFT_630318 [Morchella snyderi]|nr:hypothetical protein DFP73DRAFT_630318 [Morchella snyderi]